jgi:hypothetical protein
MEKILFGKSCEEISSRPPHLVRKLEYLRCSSSCIINIEESDVNLVRQFESTTTVG